MCLLVYVVLVTFPASVSILLLHTVFVFQIAIDIVQTYRTRKCMPRQFGKYGMIRRRRQYGNLEEDSADDKNQLLGSWEEMKKNGLRTELVHNLLNVLDYFLENWIAKVVAFILQGVGLAAFLIFWAIEMIEKKKDFYIPKNKRAHFFMRSLIILPLVVLCMSVMWTTMYQNGIARPKRSKSGQKNGNKPMNKRNARYKSSKFESCRVFYYYH